MEHNNYTPRLAHLREKAKAFTFVIFGGSMMLDSFNVEGLAFDQISIATHFGIDTGVASWSLSAYSLTYGSFLLLSGSAGDVFGHRQIYVSGLVGFTIFAALTAAIDSSAIAFFVLRAIQGICAAATIPTAYALVANLYDGKRRELAVAGLGACQAIGAAIGTILGGAFAQTSIGYRCLLWVSFGLSAILSILAFLLLPPTPYNKSKSKSLDYVGAAIITSAALLIVFGFTEALDSWTRAEVIVPICISILLIGVFVLWENVFLLRVSAGTELLIPRRVWGYANLVPIFVMTGLSFGSFYLLIMSGAQFLVRVQGHTPFMASIMFIPIALGSVVFLFILGALYNHRFLPPKWVLVVGELLVLAGEIMFSQNGPDTSYWQLSFPAFILVALGITCYFVNFLNVVFSSAPLDEQGLISGLIQTVAQISTAMTFAVGSSLVSSTEPAALLLDYRNSFYFCAGCTGLAVLVSAIFLRPVDMKAEASSDTNEIIGQRLPLTDVMEVSDMHTA